MIKKLVIAASLATLSASQFVAVASHNDVDGDKSISAQTTFAAVAEPNKMQILTLAASDEKTDPGNLRLVCREWRGIIDKLIQKSRYKDSPYADLPLISQRFIKVSYGGLECDEFYETFAKLMLIYRPTPGSEGVVLPFLGLNNPFCGTFNLDKCGSTDKHLRFTTSLKDFFEIKGGNEDRVVILFTLRSLIAQRLDSTAKPLAAVMGNWKEGFGIFWRLGNDTNLFWFDYLVAHSLDEICSINLLENWQKAFRGHARWFMPESLSNFTLLCKPKLSL